MKLSQLVYPEVGSLLLLVISLHFLLRILHRGFTSVLLIDGNLIPSLSISARIRKDRGGRSAIAGTEDAVTIW